MIGTLSEIFAGVAGLVGPVLIAATILAVIAGAVVAVCSRDGRLAIIGLAVVLTASPFLADPLPDIQGLAARVVGALLATYLLIVVERTGPTRTAGTRIGWPAEALAAGAAAVIGLGAADGLARTLAEVGLNAAGGPSVAAFEPFGPGLATGLAVLVVAIGPLLFARDAVALGVAILLGAAGVTMVRSGLAGTPSQLEELTTAGLFVAIGAGAALIGRAAAPTWGELREPTGFDIEDAADEEEIRESRAIREAAEPGLHAVTRPPVRVRGPRRREKAVESADVAAEGVAVEAAAPAATEEPAVEVEAAEAAEAEAPEAAEPEAPEAVEPEAPESVPEAGVPVVAEPAATTEATDGEPGETEAVEEDPATTEPGDQESGTTESGDQDTATAEPTVNEPASAQPVGENPPPIDPDESLG